MAKKKEEEVKQIPVDGLIDVPDFQMPEEYDEDEGIIKDECEVAFKCAFIGAGQAGGRLVESLYKIGYRRVCAVNTNTQDLSSVNIPEENKLVMDIGEGGSAKNPAKGAEAVKKYYEDVYDLMKRSFGEGFDRIIVCAGGGGGSGGGSCETIIQIAHDIAQSYKVEVVDNNQIMNISVGALVSLPKNSEGSKVNANAKYLVTNLLKLVGSNSGKLAGRTLSPLILVDNERIEKIYPNVPVTNFWNVANQSICSLFHLFNNISIQDSEFTTFDKAELKDMLSSGVLSFGACQIKKWDSDTDISFAIRDNLKKNILVSGLDIGQASKAACVVIAHPDVLDSIPQKYLDHGFEMLTRIMSNGSVVHRGIYKSNIVDVKGKPSMRIYTMLGEVGSPEERIKELSRISGTK